MPDCHEHLRRDLTAGEWKAAMMALVDKLGGAVILTQHELALCSNKQFVFRITEDGGLELKWPNGVGGPVGIA